MKNVIAAFSLLLVVLLSGALISEMPASQEKMPEEKLSKLANAINKKRAQFRMAPYIANKQLQEAAQAHADYMAKTKKLSSVGENNSTFVDRVTKAGFTGKLNSGGEILGNSNDATELVEMWSRAPGQSTQMMSNRKYIGAAISGEYACVLFFD